MRETTLSEYDKSVNRVIDYINKHLFENPDLKELSDIANISEFHFHRIFKTIIGENVGEYTNRLRLEYIAEKLQMTDYTLGDIAAKTGYGTKFALSKAFKKHFGVSPSVFRSLEKDALHSFFSKNEREATPLHPDIKEIESKNIIYIRIVDWYGSGESYRIAWQRLAAFAKENKLINKNTEFLGLCFDNPTITAPQKCRFYACITTEKSIQPVGAFGTQNIESGLFAVFTLKGSYSKLIDIYYNIFLLWLPQSGYKLDKGITFEKYLNSPDHVSEDDLLTEIYIPISKK